MISARFITFAGFATIALAAVVWELVTVRRANAVTLGGVVRWAMRARTGRILLLVFWIWLGWHLFARGSGAFQKSAQNPPPPP